MKLEPWRRNNGGRCLIRIIRSKKKNPHPSGAPPTLNNVIRMMAKLDGLIMRLFLGSVSAQTKNMQQNWRKRRDDELGVENSEYQKVRLKLRKALIARLDKTFTCVKSLLIYATKWKKD